MSNENSRSRPTARYARWSLAALVRVVGGFVGSIPLCAFVMGFLLFPGGGSVAFLPIFVFLFGWLAIGWAVLCKQRVLRILGWALAGDGAGMILDPPSCICCGGITHGGLLGCAIGAVTAALCCLPAERRFGRFAIKRSRILLLFVLFLALSACWAGTTPRLERFRAAWRLRWFGASVLSSHDRGTAIWFLGKMDDTTLQAVRPYMEKSGDVTSVRFFRAEITDSGLTHLKGLSTLRQLHLTGTNITDVGLVHLKSFPNLERLNLKQTRVGDPGLIHLKALPKLEVLDLANTKVSDAGLAHLAELRNLEELDLSYTEITEEGVEKLEQALPDTIIRHW